MSYLISPIVAKKLHDHVGIFYTKDPYWYFVCKYCSNYWYGSYYAEYEDDPPIQICRKCERSPDLDLIDDDFSINNYLERVIHHDFSDDGTCNHCGIPIWILGSMVFTCEEIRQQNWECIVNSNPPKIVICA